MSIRATGLLLGICSGVLWGLMDIASQYLLHNAQMRAALFISSTMLVTSIILVLYSLVSQPKQLVAPMHSSKGFFSLFIFGMLILATEASFFICVKESNAATAAVLAANRPFFIMLLLCFMRIRPTVKKILCCLVAVTGVTLLVTKGHFSNLSLSLGATLLGLGAPFFSACYTLQSKSLIKRFNPIVSMTWGMTFAAVLVNLYYPFWQVKQNWTFLTIFAVLWVGIVGHVLAYLCYLVSASKINPTVTGVLETVEPLTAVFLSYILFKISMDSWMLGGSILILMAVSILSFSRKENLSSD